MQVRKLHWGMKAGETGVGGGSGVGGVGERVTALSHNLPEGEGLERLSVASERAAQRGAPQPETVFLLLLFRFSPSLPSSLPFFLSLVLLCLFWSDLEVSISGA